MKRTIKSIVKLMSFGFIGLALLSCSKNETVPVNQDKAIGFNTYTGRAVSKADGSLIDKGTTTLLNGKQFVVFAYNTKTADWTGAVNNVFMKAVPVKYEGTTGDAADKIDASKYTYSPLRYWPNDEANNKLSFFAYYPYQGAGITPPQDGNGWGSYGFAAQTDPKNMIDFCLSEVAPNMTYNNTNSGQKGVVNMKFYHTLTMVKFQIKTDKDYNAYTTGDDTQDEPQVDAANSTVITLKSISLAGVKTTGTLTPVAVPTTENPAKAKWTAQAGATALNVFPASETGKALSTTAVFLPTGTEKDDAYLMVPQELGDDVIATVTYTVKTGSDAEVTNTAKVQLNLAKIVPAQGQPTEGIAEWKMNQNIVYTFVVGLQPIQFIAEVADWDPVTTATDFVIPTTPADNSGSGSGSGSGEGA